MRAYADSILLRLVVAPPVYVVCSHHTATNVFILLLICTIVKTCVCLIFCVTQPSDIDVLVTQNVVAAYSARLFSGISLVAVFLYVSAKYSIVPRGLLIIRAFILSDLVSKPGCGLRVKTPCLNQNRAWACETRPLRHAHGNGEYDFPMSEWRALPPRFLSR